MTKKYNKKGFTLLEMMLVVAIILVLASATTIGLNSYIRRSNERAQMAASKGQVYDQAMAYVDGFVNLSPAGMPDTPPVDDNTNAGAGAGGAGGAGAGGAGITVAPTAAPTSVPTVAPTEGPKPATPTPKPTATATPVPTSTPVPTATPKPTTAPAGGAGGAGTPGSTGKVKLSTDNQWYKSANTSISSSDGITKVVITAPDGVTIKQVNDANNGGQYKVNVKDGKTVTIEFDSSLSWAKKQKTINVNGIVWEGQEMNIELDFEVYN